MGRPVEEPNEDPETPLGKTPKSTKPPGTKPKDTTPKGPVPKGTKSHEPVPKNTGGTAPGAQSTWYKSDVVYDTKRTGQAAIPPENLLDITRKRKASDQPKSSTSGKPTAHKRKRTTPAHWLQQTQPRTTYMVGNKITPVWSSCVLLSVLCGVW